MTTVNALAAKIPALDMPDAAVGLLPKIRTRPHAFVHKGKIRALVITAHSDEKMREQLAYLAEFMDNYDDGELTPAEEREIRAQMAKNREEMADAISGAEAEKLLNRLAKLK